MTKPTGNPPGRPRGAKNRRTAETEAAALTAAGKIALAVPGAFEGDAHAFLMLIYKDPSQPLEFRLEAAGKAIRYEKPALASVDVTSQNEHHVYAVSDKPLSNEMWVAKHAEPKPN
ncbi:hypothetical protein [Lichenifustis flavocetrariae]|uniref:Uncharacterized protein n=1 Tax=Lichenifustis flavocetrariae TaxID=2949735 RepID=A0AA42CQ10_9HYPH|nr:hypothetical protein [Lichenifustis flavocetrariae]MCW6510967.1 hypothetical protein [Lichenifustis flavocetrariae]